MLNHRLLAAPWLCVLMLAPVCGQETSKALPVTGDPVPQLAPFDDLMLSFLAQHEVPGAALAVAKDGKLVYARGFGYADPDAKEKTLPTSLFRIASVSKPITAVAILMLIERGKLKLDDNAFKLLAVPTPPGRKRDPRLDDITVRHLLQHTGGWDRAKSFDAMFRPVLIAKDLGSEPPAGPNDVIRYMVGQPLDFDPGSRYAYSNFGYCVLGRIIEKVSGQPYELFVQENVLRPVGATQTRLGKTLQRADGEVKYAATGKKRAVVGPNLGERVPLPYGAWYLEAMDAHGGWLSTAPDLAKFAAAVGRPDRCPLLGPATWQMMFTRPEGPPGLDDDGKPAPTYYGLGWQVRPQESGFNAWHNGALDGTASMLVRRHDGLVWAVLFNARANPKGEYLSKLIDPLLHEAAAKVKQWPQAAG